MVTMPSGKSIESTGIFAEEGRDLAVIKVPAEGNPFLGLSLAPPAIGSEVIAIGSPGLRVEQGSGVVVSFQGTMTVVRETRPLPGLDSSATQGVPN